VYSSLCSLGHATLPVHEKANQPNKHPLSSSKVQVDLISVEKNKKTPRNQRFESKITFQTSIFIGSMETKSLHIPWPKMPRPARQIPLISDEF